MGMLGTISHYVSSRLTLLVFTIMLVPFVLGNNAFGLEYDDYRQLEEKITSLDTLINDSEHLQLGKINFELISINNDFQQLQNSIKNSKNHFEFAKYKQLTKQFLDISNQFKKSLANQQQDMEMDDVLLTIQIRKNINEFHISDRILNNHIETQTQLETERLMSDSRKYIQNTLNDVVVEKHFESYSPQINWLDVYKIAFNKIQKDEKFHAIPMTIDRLMLQYHDEDLLRELLLLKLDIELLLDTTTEETTYTDDDNPPPAQEEESEGEEPPGEIVPVPKTSLDGNMDETLNSQISTTIDQITNIVYDHENALKESQQRISSSSSSSKSFGSGSGGSGETGSEVGDRPRDNNKSDF